MSTAEMKNAPPLYGWAIACATGLVAFGISYLVIDLEFMGAAFVAVAVLLLVGVIFTWAESPRADVASARKAEPVKVAVQAPVAPALAPAAPAAAAKAETASEGIQPAALSGPQGVADDLKQISGVGPVLERKLNDLGIYHFWQIARWTEAEVAWVDGFLNFKGRIGRDEWISQAIRLAQTSSARPPE